jgi:hypothetical protein
MFDIIWSIAVVITVAVGTWQVYRVLTGKTGEQPPLFTRHMRMDRQIEWLPKIVGKTIARSYLRDDTETHIVEFTDGTIWKAIKANDGGRISIVTTAEERATLLAQREAYAREHPSA